MRCRSNNRVAEAVERDRRRSEKHCEATSFARGFNFRALRGGPVEEFRIGL